MDPASPQGRRALSALALMYFVQGLPIGLAFSALGVLIRHAGHSVADTALVGFAFLPWALKFLWAAPIDNLCARLGFFAPILFLQMLAVFACVMAAMIDPATSLTGAITAVTGLNLVLATQDIASNGYAVSRLRGKGAGPANAVQVAGFLIGTIAGGPGFLFSYPMLGWAGGMAVFGCVLVAAGLAEAALLGRDAQRHQPSRANVRLRDVLRQRDLGWAILLALSFKFGGTAANTLLAPWLVDQRLSLTDISRLQLYVQLATATGTVAIGVPLIRSLGLRRAAIMASAVSALMLGVPVFLNFTAPNSPVTLYALLSSQGLVDGAMYAAIWALIMNWASPDRPGTDFTLMQCCESVANMAGAGMIGGLLQSHGYRVGFAMAWVGGGAASCLVIMAALQMRSATGGSNDTFQPGV